MKKTILTMLLLYTSYLYCGEAVPFNVTDPVQQRINEDMYFKLNVSNNSQKALDKKINEFSISLNANDIINNPRNDVQSGNVQDAIYEHDTEKLGRTSASSRTNRTMEVPLYIKSPTAKIKISTDTTIDPLYDLQIDSGTVFVKGITPAGVVTRTVIGNSGIANYVGNAIPSTGSLSGGILSLDDRDCRVVMNGGSTFNYAVPGTPYIKINGDYPLFWRTAGNMSTDMNWSPINGDETLGTTDYHWYDLFTRQADVYEKLYLRATYVDIEPFMTHISSRATPIGGVERDVASFYVESGYNTVAPSLKSSLLLGATLAYMENRYGQIQISSGDIVLSTSTHINQNLYVTGFSSTTGIYYGDGSGLYNVAGAIDTNCRISTGNIQVQLDSEISSRTHINHITQEPSGFPNNTDSQISYAPTTRTFSIYPTSTDFKVYYGSNVFTYTSSQTVIFPNTSGLQYVWFSSTGGIQSGSSFSSFNLPIIATVYLSTAITNGLIGYERHGLTMDWKTRLYLHKTVGTRYESGLSASFGDTRSTITAGVIWDEDINFNIDQTTSSIILYRNKNNVYEWGASSPTPYMTDGTNILYDNNGSTTPADANKYVAYWIFATNDRQFPIFSIMGQRQDTLIADARNNNTYESLNLGALPTNEMKILYRVILRNDSTPYEEALDLRTISNLPGGTYVATDINSLSGNLPASKITSTASGNITATNVQSALDQISVYMYSEAYMVDLNVGALLDDNDYAITTDTGSVLMKR